MIGEGVIFEIVNKKWDFTVDAFLQDGVPILKHEIGIAVIGGKAGGERLRQLPAEWRDNVRWRNADAFFRLQAPVIA